jgi:hypothetical protein
MRLTLEEAVECDGRTLHEIAQAALFGDENAPTLCDHGCEVEPDGIYPQACPTLLREAGLI